MSLPPDVSPALRQMPEGVVVSVYVQPKSRREQIVGMQADRLKLAVTEPPDRGRANEAVMRLLARTVGIAPSSVRLLRGDTSRNKELLLAGQVLSEVSSRLLIDVGQR